MLRFFIVSWALLSFSLIATEANFITVNQFKLEYEIAGSGKHIVLLEAGGGSPMTDWDPVFHQIAQLAKLGRGISARAGRIN